MEKIISLRKYVEKFNNIDEYSQFLVMKDMFDTYKAKVIEG